jgi:hypothetical protein
MSPDGCDDGVHMVGHHDKFPELVTFPPQNAADWIPWYLCNLGGPGCSFRDQRLASDLSFP